MIGILIFTHGSLCTILKADSERLTGLRERVGCVAMIDGETIEALTQRVEMAIDEIDRGQGAIVFVDVAGGTPWNIIGHLKKTKGRNLRRIAGGGMPAVIKALQDHGEHIDVDSWADELTTYAKNRVVGD